MMHQTTIATSADWDEAIGFLEARGLVKNPWLVWMVDSTLRHSSERKVILCRREGNIAGVAQFLRFADLAEPPRVTQDCDYEADLDGVDRGAVETLVAALPAGLSGRLSLLSPVAQEVFDTLPGVKRREGDLFYTVSATELRPEPGEDVTELNGADAALFAGTERAAEGNPLSRVGENGGRKFAIVREGRAIASASVGPLIHEWCKPHNVMAICGVFTESRYRRQGLGKRLVSHITEVILGDGHAPLYWTAAGNTASRNLARSLGYRQFGRAVTYVGVTLTA